ncbi:hypothetical protein DL96DRAFT_1580682 [Flagelloscypha sp. PMI_526]|nr:hypothetical protein DL96DRAFT_1580682 [Flagelloscypha sp. PMI_526]
MIPSEAIFLKVYGECVISNFYLLVVQTVGSTLGLFLYIVSTVMLSRRPVKGKGTVFLLILTTLSLFVSLFDWSAFVFDNLAVFHIGLVGLPGSTIETQFLAVLKHNEWILKFGEWPLQIHLLICDTIVVSRVWAMFPERRRERWCGAFLLAGDFATNVGITLADMGLPISDYTPSVEPSVLTTNWYIAGMILSLVTNIVATGFIGWKAWRHRQSLKHAGFSNKFKHSPVQRILALFLESGVAFMILQILVIITQFVPVVERSTLAIVSGCIGKAFINLAAIYPTIVIIIVERRRGILDETQYFGEGTLDLESDRPVDVKKACELSEIRFGADTVQPERTYQSRRSALGTQQFVISFASVGSKKI